MGTDAADLDHRRLRRESRRTRRGLELTGDRGGRGLPHRAAMLADKEHHEVAGRVVVDAGDEGVAALDAMHEAVVAEEIKRAINGDRRRPAAAHV